MSRERSWINIGFNLLLGKLRYNMGVNEDSLTTIEQNFSLSQKNRSPVHVYG
jgi:hypothetical protein